MKERERDRRRGKRGVPDRAARENGPEGRTQGAGDPRRPRGTGRGAAGDATRTSRAHRASTRAGRAAGAARTRVGTIAIALLGAAAVALLVWLGRRPAPRPPSPTTADSAATLSTEHAYREAVRRSLGGNPASSLPFFRQVRATMRNDTWEFHFEYGVVLQNCAIDSRVRSSFDRHVYLEEALAEIDRSARMCPDRRKRAIILLQKGLVLRTWGFPIEALQSAAEASALDPDYRAASEGYRALLARLEHPEDSRR